MQFTCAPLSPTFPGDVSGMPHLGLWGTFGFKFHLIQIPSLHLARAPVCHPQYAWKPGMGREAPGSPRRLIWGQMLPQASALCCASYYRPHQSWHLGSSQAELYSSQHLGSQPLWAPSVLSFPICKMEITIVRF